MIAYTYSPQTRPFEHEGYNKDFDYRAISQAYFTLYRAAQNQAGMILNALENRRQSGEFVSYDAMANTPEYREYRAIMDSADAWFKLMGFPGYWTNWQ